MHTSNSHPAFRIWQYVSSVKIPSGYFLLSALLIFFGLFGSAQESYRTQVKNWTGEEAEIILPLDNPLVIGTIDEAGQATLILTDDLATELAAARKKANEESESIKMVNRTVHEAFYCGSDEVVVENGDLELLPVSMQSLFFAGILEEQKPIGMMRLASSEAFNSTYFELGRKDMVKGSYATFFYVPEAASVQGICKTKSLRLDGESSFFLTHDYRIDLQKGWNLVVTEVLELYEDQEGRTLPLYYRMQTVDEIPEDLGFIFTD